MTTYSQMPGSYDAGDDGRRLKLNAALAERGRTAVIAAQHWAFQALVAEVGVERILNMSDEEVEAELRAEGIDPEQNAIEMQAIFERAVAQARALRNTALAERFNLG